MALPTSSPTHEVFVNRNGTTSLRHLASGEVMHSSVGPLEETTLLYIEQSRLSERLLPGPSAGAAERSPLVLYDVGLGAATNALAALQRAAGPRPSRPLHVISFETDVSGLRLALAHRDRFPFFEGLEHAAEALLDSGCWESPDGSARWELRLGDFREAIVGCPPPELVFFDLYSPNTCPELWSVGMFERLRTACARSGAVPGSSVFTYSAATRVRAALLLAGFFVGYGRSTGAKRDTTAAATRLEDLERPLDARWLERLRHSHDPIPFGWPPGSERELLARVLEHPQWAEQNSVIG